MCIATYKEFFICAIRVIFVSLKWIREHFWFYCGYLKKACDVCLAGSGVSLQRPDSQALTSLCCSINWLPSLGNYWIRLWGFCPLQLLILEKGPPGHVGFPACERHFHSNPCPLAVIHCGLWALSKECFSLSQRPELWQSRSWDDATWWWAQPLCLAGAVVPKHISTCLSLFVKCAFFKVTLRLCYIFHAQKWINDA